jgi:hypothetical protein
MKKIILIIILLAFFASSIFSQVIKVEFTKNQDGSYTLLRDDQPYYIKGAGTTNKTLLPELAARGGNSIRTWGIDAMTLSVLNEAHKHGLSVILGLWMNKEKDGFDYNNEDRVNAQLEKFRGNVKQFRNHPALLAWSIGNEVEIGYSNLKVWNAVNDISLMIHEEDGNHPTMTITACINKDKANAIAERAPDLDCLGINAYACISGVHSSIMSSNWNKPYIITEWGVNGPWEVGKTSWGAPLEPSSTTKKEQFLQRYQDYIQPHTDIIPGSYAFYWNSKFEGTQTWFGLFVNNETTEAVDGLEYLWTNSQPLNRAPEITSLTLNSKNQNQSVLISKMSGNLVQVDATDPESDELDYEYLIRPESGNYLLESIPGASFQAIPGIINEQVDGECILNFDEIHDNQNLRLYVLIHDGEGHLATASFPFQTKFNKTGVYEAENNAYKIKVFPNPSGTWITLSLNDNSEPVKVQVFNPLGKLVLEEYDKDLNEARINITSLPMGLYIIKVYNRDDEMVMTKVMKN